MNAIHGSAVVSVALRFEKETWAACGLGGCGLGME